MKSLVLLTAIFISGSSHAFTARVNAIHLCKDRKITKVELFKYEHRLSLLCESLSGEQMEARSYDVMLSREAIGPKQEEGDMRVPEGKYTLDWKLKKSKFFLALHVSYPNKQDRENARENGITNIGGDIMLHGMPNRIDNYDLELSKHPILRELIYQAMYFVDWTQGCIAMPNNDIQEIWDLVQTPTDFEIFP